MKKDIFNGKIKPEYKSYTLFSLIFFSVIAIGCGIFFLLTVIFYTEMFHSEIESGMRILLSVASACSFLLGTAYPITAFCLIRSYPKHQKLLFLLIKEYLLIDIDKSK